jgi:hypothetical protein
MMQKTTSGFLLANRTYSGDDCLIWPWSKNPINGYGHLVIAKKAYAAHRLMCEIVHGPKPSPQHQAAHSCHNRACVNPRHLSWKTHSENMLDKRENGTVNNAWWGNRGKLTPAEASAILDLKGHKTQAAIAKQFGITESNVRNLHNGKIWTKRIAEYRAAQRISA